MKKGSTRSVAAPEGLHQEEPEKCEEKARGGKNYFAVDKYKAIDPLFGPAVFNCRSNAGKSK